MPERPERRGVLHDLRDTTSLMHDRTRGEGERPERPDAFPTGVFPTGVFGDTLFNAFLSAASAVAVSRAAMATVTALNGNCRVG